jgi:hypothetical protein
MREKRLIFVVIVVGIAFEEEVLVFSLVCEVRSGLRSGGRGFFFDADG